MRTLTKEVQEKISPDKAVELLKEGNKRFIKNLSLNRNLLQQVNETSDGQHPFAVIISCMDSRTSSELVFDQGLGDVFSIRVAGNVINEDILASAEYGCKVVGAKVIAVLGHTECGAVGGAVKDVDLGHLHFITHKIQRCIPTLKKQYPKADHSEFCNHVTRENVVQSILDLKSRSSILEDMCYKGEIKIVGGVYDVKTGVVEFFEPEV
jgi:carbonic anhydrase